MTRITAIGACFNRPEKTLASISRLLNQVRTDEPTFIKIVLADASTDTETADLVAQRWPLDVSILRLNASSFWAESMTAAESVAVLDEPDFILWFNDDVDIASDAVSRLLAVANESDIPSIVAGACRGHASNETTYSGLRRRAANRPTSLVRVEPGSLPVKVDTFNGNLVLIPRVAQARIGPIDPAYKHSYGDLDYGLRATRLGIPVLLAPGWVGMCNRNSPRGTWRDRDVSRFDRLKDLFGPKGVPLRAHFRYCQKHTGGRILGLGYGAATYAKILAAVLLKRGMA